MKCAMLILVAMCSLMIASASFADVLEVTPSVAALRTNDEGETEIFLQFDLSGMRQAEEFKVSEAVLDWTFSSLDEGSSFVVRKITEDWSTVGIQGESAVAVESSVADDWDLGSLDKERLGSFVRLDLTDIVRGWVESPTTNHGVLIVTESIPEESAAQQTGAAMLTVRYGCCK